MGKKLTPEKRARNKKIGMIAGLVAAGLGLAILTVITAGAISGAYLGYAAAVASATATAATTGTAAGVSAVTAASAIASGAVAGASVAAGSSAVVAAGVAASAASITSSSIALSQTDKNNKREQARLGIDIAINSLAIVGTLAAIGTAVSAATKTQTTASALTQNLGTLTKGVATGVAVGSMAQSAFSIEQGVREKNTGLIVASSIGIAFSAFALYSTRVKTDDIARGVRTKMWGETTAASSFSQRLSQGVRPIFYRLGIALNTRIAVKSIETGISNK